MNQMEEKNLENNENVQNEVVQNDVQVSEQNNEEMTTMDNVEVVSLKPRQIIKGTVLRISDDEVVVNIGYKADGIISKDDVLLEDGKSLQETFKVGDEIEVEVVKVNDGEGNVVLSHKSVAVRKAWKEIEEGFKQEREFKGTCVEVVKGGVMAEIKGIRAFVPASQLSTHYVEDLSVFVGQPLRLRIIELERGRNRVVASQRVILQAEEEARKKALWDSLQEGQRITGTVKRLTSFGAFVDIGGVDGLIHISDLSWGRVGHPREVLKEGQQVEVVVLGVDREKERISLGYKQTLPHPWDNVEEKYPVGSVVKGKVVRIASFGAFVELEPGVDGLVHISQVANKRVNKVEDVLKVGDEVQAKVLEVDGKAQRIGLSIRETLPEEKEPPKPKKQEGPTFEKEQMTVNLGEFFPKNE